MWTKQSFLSWLLLLLAPGFGMGQSPSAPPPTAPQPLPKSAPKLQRDVVVVTLGSSITMNRPSRQTDLPAWTGGYDRVPPQINGQNLFFRVFEMLNDHENMCWRRLTDGDWKRVGAWPEELDLPYNVPCYKKRVAYVAADPEDYAELSVPKGYEKLDLIYATDPRGDTIRVTIDGKPPERNATIDSWQDTRIPPGAELLPDLDTLDSHGEPIQLKRPTQGTKNLYELRPRYALDPARPHVVRVQRGTREEGKRILIWGAVYWRGNCAGRAARKGGLNCGDLPRYAAIQEVAAMKPDYVLMEAINVRDAPEQIAQTLGPGFGWCAQRGKSFKTLVYATTQANSRAFRARHKAKLTDETADGCVAELAKLCKTYRFPLVDAGPAADRWLAANPQAKFDPHIQGDWYHPAPWGVALFAETIHEGVRTHWPELPIRPIHLPAPPR